MIIIIISITTIVIIIIIIMFMTMVVTTVTTMTMAMAMAMAMVIMSMVIISGSADNEPSRDEPTDTDPLTDQPTYQPTSCYAQRVLGMPEIEMSQRDVRCAEAHVMQHVRHTMLDPYEL